MYLRPVRLRVSCPRILDMASVTGSSAATTGNPNTRQRLSSFRRKGGLSRVKSTSPGFCAIRSEEHTSELQSLMRISYAVFCLKKKTHKNHTNRIQLMKKH